MPDLSALLKHISLPKAESLEEAQRLFHGRGHAYKDLHHVTVDWLPPVLLITLFAPESPQAIENLANQLQQALPSCKSIQVQHRHELQGPTEVVSGDDIQTLNITENQLNYQIQLGKSRNTGLFLDIKNGRRWVQEHSKNKRVLNLFAYTCGFSIAAIEGGAASVMNIDLSSPALNVGRTNHHLNEHSLKNVSFAKLNIFKSFGRLKKGGPFDLLICDPPTFQKGSVDIKRDYPKIMRRLDEFMATGSTLMLCLNAPELERDFLINNMQEYAPQYQYIEQISTPDVYKEAEEKGLKVLIFKHQT